MGNKSSFKKKPKAYKTRHHTKGQIKAANKGRVDASDGVAKKAPKHSMSRSERRNQNNQMRLQKQKQRVEDTKIFSSRVGVPRNVALVPLTGDINTVAVAEKLAAALGGAPEREGVLNVTKFHQRLRFFPTQYNQFFDILDAAKSADFVVFVLSANEEISDYGEQIMRCITMQGVSTSLGMIWGVNKTAKEKDIRASLTSWFSHFFPEERLYSVDSDSEASIAGRILCQKAPKGVHWRDERPYIVAEEAHVSGEKMIVDGFVRAQNLSPDMFMHVPGFGDYKIADIVELTNTDPRSWESVASTEVNRLVPVDEEVELESDDDDERLEGQGVRIDGLTDVTTLVEAGVADQGPQMAKNVPQGTSDYQRAWYLEGEDYRSDSDEDDVLTDEEGELVENQTGPQQDEEDAEMEADEEESEEDQDEDDESEPEDIEFDDNKDPEREAKDDLEFPDEVEVDPRASAKERFSRYRGVRSIRNTDWNAREKDPRAPEEYPRLYRPGEVIATRNRKEKLLEEGPLTGTKVRVFLVASQESARLAPQEDINITLNRAANPVTAYGLLPGEEKLGYVNAGITMDSEVVDPIKSKSPIVVQYGPRRLLVNPLFNQGGPSDNNVHKFNRFLHPGRSAVATFIAPVSLSHAPVVFYRTQFVNEQIVLGSGTVQDCDANRIIVKTAILTGIPVKIHRKLVTVRHMFFSRDDVEWFRSVPLFTKLGAQGYIKESLGMHGLFKATFDKKIKSEDTIALPLYKRVWPKFAQPAPF